MRTLSRSCAIAAFVACLIAAPLQAMAQEARPLIVFAAASLQTALDAIGQSWQRQTGRRVIFSFAGSPALARQLEQAAPADIFLSADQEWMDWAAERNLIRKESRTTLLGNRLVLIAARDDVTDLKIRHGFPLAAAVGQSRLVTGNPQSVPVGRYAMAALKALGVWAEVAPRIAGTENVRVALAFVARGEARFGIVYQTDAMSELLVRVVDIFPAESHPPIEYPAAITAVSASPDAAGFLAYLRSPEAIRIFETGGFAVMR